MYDAARVSEDINSIDDLVEIHVRSLANKLSLPHTLQEIEAEVTVLTPGGRGFFARLTVSITDLYDRSSEAFAKGLTTFTYGR